MIKKNTQTVAEEAVVTGPRSVARILGLFAVLAKSSDGLTLAELSNALAAPKSSLLTLLRPLVGDGYLVHGNSRYRLGPFIYRLAADVLATRNFPKLMRPYLEDLAGRTGESVYLSVLDRETRTVTHIDGIDGTQAVRYVSPLGAPRPLYCTAPGRLLLAFQDDAWREGFLKTAKLKPMTSKTITDRQALRQLLKKIRQEEVSISVGQLSEGAAGMAVPVYGASGLVAAALVIAAPADRMQQKLRQFREMLTDVAAQASGVLRETGGGAAAK